MRQAVGVSISGTGYVLSLCPFKLNLNTIQFCLINHNNLEDTIEHLTPSCCLDILHKGFFRNVCYCIASDLLLPVITSLLSGVFPQALRTAVSSLSHFPKRKKQSRHITTQQKKLFKQLNFLALNSFHVF